ncbi:MULTISPECIES: hypothetical protein [unclassified Sphingomonas]|uniref:hypothetical protein n=1 Tax=unclassified Sphingomonas TaxID=196159 RepID=UPI0006F480AB|nr:MULTISPECIES: hypothetical protein [unclassified Sphingomonas]KQX23280.1 hypothetical protein ASD17_02885 [Sphingomonas sp. Root1294]KQY68128.1 hypothetical protein ASD39_05405 [Sphingomonas sp. Root50]KRB91020.1 hypothetical protein ASE22_12200 [Sphingomonas sp. Root720]
MRSRILRGGALPALGAVLLLVHPPVMAKRLVLHGLQCGSAGAIDIEVGRIPGRSQEDDGPCMAGCHAACAGRKRHLDSGDDQ